jgi:tight adherence protein B
VPHLYLDVKDEPLTWYLLAGTLFWLGVGNASMFKMSNFKF